MTESKTAEQLAGEVKAAFDAKVDQVKAIADEALGKAAKGEDLSAATKQLADEALVGMNEAKARLDELEQKLARRGPEDQARHQSVGEQVMASEEIKSFLESKVWAEVQDVLPSRAERLADSIVIANRPARIRMRHLAGITPDMRVIIGNRVLQIVSGPAEIGRRERIELIVEQHSSEGAAP